MADSKTAIPVPVPPVEPVEIQGAVESDYLELRGLFATDYADLLPAFDALRPQILRQMARQHAAWDAAQAGKRVERLEGSTPSRAMYDDLRAEVAAEIWSSEHQRKVLLQDLKHDRTKAMLSNERWAREALARVLLANPARYAPTHNRLMSDQRALSRFFEEVLQDVTDQWESFNEAERALSSRGWQVIRKNGGALVPNTSYWENTRTEGYGVLSQITDNSGIWYAFTERELGSAPPKEHRYGSRSRSIGLYTAPKGYTRIDVDSRYPGGVAVYEEPLSSADIRRYDLVDLNTPETREIRISERILDRVLYPEAQYYDAQPATYQAFADAVMDDDLARRDGLDFVIKLSPGAWEGFKIALRSPVAFKKAAEAGMAAELRELQLQHGVTPTEVWQGSPRPKSPAPPTQPAPTKPETRDPNEVVIAGNEPMVADMLLKALSTEYRPGDRATFSAAEHRFRKFYGAELPFDHRIMPVLAYGADQGWWDYTANDIILSQPDRVPASKGGIAADEQKEWHFDAGTVYFKGGLGEIGRLEGKDINVRMIPYAQYPRALEVFFTPKGKRKPRALPVRTPGDFFVFIEAGRPAPSPDDAFLSVEDSSVPGVRVQRGRYMGHDPRWVSDFMAKVPDYAWVWENARFARRDGVNSSAQPVTKDSIQTVESGENIYVAREGKRGLVPMTFGSAAPAQRYADKLGEPWAILREGSNYVVARTKTGGTPPKDPFALPPSPLEVVPEDLNIPAGWVVLPGAPGGESAFQVKYTPIDGPRVRITLGRGFGYSVATRTGAESPIEWTKFKAKYDPRIATDSEREVAFLTAKGDAIDFTNRFMASVGSYYVVAMRVGQPNVAEALAGPYLTAELAGRDLDKVTKRAFDTGVFVRDGTWHFDVKTGPPNARVRTAAGPGDNVLGLATPPSTPPRPSRRTKGSLTDHQYDLLGRIIRSDYQDGANPVDNPIWAFDIYDVYGASAGGIVKGALDAGLIGEERAARPRSEWSVWITQKGYDLWKDAEEAEEARTPEAHPVNRVEPQFAPNTPSAPTAELTVAESFARTIRSELEPMFAGWRFSVQPVSVLGDQEIFVDIVRLRQDQTPKNNIIENHPSFRVAISSDFKQNQPTWRRDGEPTDKVTADGKFIGYWPRNLTPPKFRKYTSRDTGMPALTKVVNHVIKWFKDNRDLLVEPRGSGSSPVDPQELEVKSRPTSPVPTAGDSPAGDSPAGDSSTGNSPTGVYVPQGRGLACYVQVRLHNLTYGASLDPTRESTLLLDTPILCRTNDGNYTLGSISSDGMTPVKSWTKPNAEETSAEIERLTQRLLRRVPGVLHEGAHLVLLYAVTAGQPFQIQGNRVVGSANVPNAQQWAASITNALQWGWIVQRDGGYAWAV